MSRKAKDRLYALLPSVYRQQDINQQIPGGSLPLQDLMAILETVLDTLENDIDGLYQNWFIETCSEWVAPYIGDLVGAGLLRSVNGNAAVSARAYVANTLHYRKRKGTVAVIEEIARDVTGWDAHAVEFFQLLSISQNINHIRPQNSFTPRIVDPESAELVDTAFDTASHTLDVRNTKNGQGYYNIPNLGIFLWRLTAYPIKYAKAFSHGDGKYSFSQLGLDIPLFNHPVDQLADLLTGEINVSSPIRRVALKKYLSAYYGPDRSILVEVDGEIKAADQILVCDLSNDSEGDWNIPDEFKSSPDDCKGKVAIDPALGRLMLPNKAAGKIYVTYYYGFSADMGSGLYKRDLYQAPADAGMYLIGADATYKTLSEAVAAWKSKKANAVFEFINNDSYVEASLDIQIPAGVEIIIRSAQEARATITAAGETSKLNISGEEGSTLVLDGLILDRNLPLTINKQLTVSQEVAAKSSLGSLTVQNCALLPPSETEANSIVVDGNDFVKVTLNKSITGPVYMKTSQGTLTLKDSVVDCGSIESSGAKHIAVDCIEASVENTTIFGKSNFETLNYASNVIFTDTVKVKRRQQGCVRFSYIAHRYDPDLMIASKMPRCYRCQPESATSKIAPRFTSKRYGNPGYAQLHRQAVKEISEGADNGSEIGAFNQIYQAHRINNLRATFSEYLPFGLEAGIILVT